MEESKRMEQYAVLFGGALSMNLMVERELCSRSQRMIQEDSSYLQLHNSANNLQRIEYCDFMNIDNPLQKTTNMNDLILNNKI